MFKFIKLALPLLGVTAILVLFGITRAASALEVGDKMPDFSLQASDGKTYTLAEFHGKKPVVIAFFPKAFTQGWTIECKALRDSAKEIGKFDVAYFMASVDSLKDNTKFAKMHNAGFPILADPEKKLATACGVLFTKGFAKGFAKRWTYYVNKDGIIIKIDKKVKPQTAGVVLARNMEALGFPKK